MAIYRLKSKLFAFNIGTYQSLVDEIASGNPQPDAQKKLDAIKRKYAKQIQEYEASRAKNTAGETVKSQVVNAGKEQSKKNGVGIFKRAANYVKSHPVKSGVIGAAGLGLAGGGAYLYNRNKK